MIGGLLVSTLGTLLMLPPIFALLIGRGRHVAPSIHPDNAHSRHFDREGLRQNGGDADAAENSSGPQERRDASNPDR